GPCAKTCARNCGHRSYACSSSTVTRRINDPRPSNRSLSRWRLWPNTLPDRRVRLAGKSPVCSIVGGIDEVTGVSRMWPCTCLGLPRLRQDRYTRMESEPGWCGECLFRGEDERVSVRDTPSKCEARGY